MIKILHTADWHLGLFKSPMKDKINLRTEDTKRCLDEMVRVAEEEKPDYAIVLGDIFNIKRPAENCEEIITATYYIMKLAIVSKQVIVMRGTPNHDGEGQFNVLKEMFGDYKNVYVIDTPQVLSFQDVDIAVLPGFDRGVYRAKFPGLSKEDENMVFTQELSNIVLGLKAQCSPSKRSILMAHYTVPGCNMESGQSMFLSQFEPIIPQETLLAAGYDLVALGHIHRPQQVTTNPWFYSGAINALNFNDEGQERGFWIHNANSSGGWESTFHKTPIREFITIHLTDADITAINIGKIDEVALNHWRFNGAIQDRIVRVYYNCSSESNKALNTAVLEKALLEDGAFMVWEILPDKISEFANRTELMETTDPEANLIKYLEEKQFLPEKIQELVLKARPVIADAEASMPTSINTGTFEPIEIAVKNYRNYEEETFNFENITFCTINGQNGAGKSSLFMDAISDCLFEEPREGVISDAAGKSPWLRNDEKARSGSIMFTFRIGEKKYRVTRTRARSGKGTLNIALFVDGDWKDCSKEKYKDTQQEISNILGMDSFTFKSCALIMQDQYGLFLQAKPEERIEVLGTLLGLNIYQAMEKIAQDKSKLYGAKNKELKQEVEIHNNTITSLGNPNEDLVACNAEIGVYESRLQAKTAERDKNKLLLANQQEAAGRRAKALTVITALQSKRTSVEQNKITQQAIIDSSAAILSAKPEIDAKVAEYNSLVEKEKLLAGESALYTSKMTEAESLKQQVQAEENSIRSIQAKAAEKEAELAALQPTDQNDVIKSKAEEYELMKKKLEEAYGQERQYRAIDQKLTQAKYRLQQAISCYETDINSLKLSEGSLKKKTELLSNVDCVDISNAKCGFLADAILAKQLLEEYPEKYEKRKKEHEEALEPIKIEIENLQKQLDSMGFDFGVVAALANNVSELKPYVIKLQELNQRESRIALIQANLDNLQLNMFEAEKRLAAVKLKAAEAEQACGRYAKSFEEHALIQSSIQTLKPWLEKEMQLPVAEERKTTAMSRILELTQELSNIDTEIAEKQAEADKEILVMGGIEELQAVVNGLETEVNALNAILKEKQMKIGALQQKAEQITKLKKEIAALQDKQVGYATETADYGTLKAAFSQSGVPHQIIRSIVPQLTATSNNILGQMTGGKMGVEFRLERQQKNGKEKCSLDIFIEEYGKAQLPYLSKSGGEKVKSSLAVILALAEIKSSSAGIQLGMLFIDEPPFLDGDGVGAYCDALETIQNRYRNMKIMAITHDPTMKARFPQNLDVVKTEHGSKVIC